MPALSFFFQAPLIDWPESDLKLLTAVWIRAYKNAWNLGKSTANCLFTFPRDKGGLQVKLPLGTLFTSVCGNLERCSQFDDGTRQMLALSYQEALQENGCLDLLELQDASQHLSWKVGICVGTITQNQWDHGLLGGWLSKTIFHYLYAGGRIDFMRYKLKSKSASSIASSILPILNPAENPPET